MSISSALFWLLAATLTALLAGIVLAPLFKSKYSRKLGFILLIIMPILGLGLYLLLGTEP